MITTFASWPRRRRFAAAGLAVATVLVVAVVLVVRVSSSPHVRSTIPSTSSPATLLAPFETGPAMPAHAQQIPQAHHCSFLLQWPRGRHGVGGPRLVAAGAIRGPPALGIVSLHP